MSIRRLINKITNWYLQHFLTLIMIPVTFTIFVVGIYGRGFTEDLKDIKNENIIVFFRKQKKLNDESLSKLDAFPNCLNDTNNTAHKHILILDRTLSTKEVAEDAYNKNDIISSLNNVFGVIDTNVKTKELFVLKVFEKILKMDYKKIDSLIYITYDGNPDNLNDFKTNRIEWDEKKIRDFFISQKDSLFVTLNYQETDFTKIFTKINSLKDKNTVVTIVSDFYHEKKTVTPLHIEMNLQNGMNENNQFNCIYIVPNGIEKKQKSDSLINLMTDKMHGTTQVIVPIISLDIFESDDKSKLDKDLIQCFSPVYKASERNTITIFYPMDKRDNKEYKTAKCKIVFCDSIKNDSCHYWKIIDSFSRNNNEKFIYKTKDKKIYESKVEINSPDWRSVYLSDTLIIEFPINSIRSNSHYSLSVIHDNKNIRYRIDFKECIPSLISNISIVMIFSILIFFLLLFLCWTRLHFDTINTYIDDKNLKRKGHHATSIEHGYYTIKYLFNRNIMFTITTLIFFSCSLYCCFCKPCRWGEIGFTLIIFVLLFIHIINFKAVCYYTKKKKRRINK